MLHVHVHVHDRNWGLCTTVRLWAHGMHGMMHGCMHRCMREKFDVGADHSIRGNPVLTAAHPRAMTDNSTMLIAFTLVIGVIGAAVFFLSQPAPVKKRSKGGDLKPRGAPRRLPRRDAFAYTSRAAETSCAPAEDLYAQ